MVSDDVTVILKITNPLSTHVQLALRFTCTTATAALVEKLCSMIMTQDVVDARGLAKFLLSKGEIKMFGNDMTIFMATELCVRKDFTLQLCPSGHYSPYRRTLVGYSMA